MSKIREKVSLECGRMHIWALKTQKLPGPSSGPWTPTANCSLHSCDSTSLHQQLLASEPGVPPWPNPGSASANPWIHTPGYIPPDTLFHLYTLPLQTPYPQIPNPPDTLPGYPTPGYPTPDAIPPVYPNPRKRHWIRDTIPTWKRHETRDTLLPPPREQNDWQTPVKALPSRNYWCGR